MCSVASTMVTYYRDDALHITTTGVWIGDRQYPLHALELVWHRRTSRLRRGGYMVATRGGLVMVLVALVVGIGVAVWRVSVRGADPKVLAGGILAVIVVGAVAAFAIESVLGLVDRTHEHGQGVHEIWARTAHGDVLIFQSTDSLRFGQAYRALQRAIDGAG
jgi:hypothetical protein